MHVATSVRRDAVISVPYTGPSAGDCDSVATPTYCVILAPIATLAVKIPAPIRMRVDIERVPSVSAERHNLPAHDPTSILVPVDGSSHENQHWKGDDASTVLKRHLLE